MKTFKDTLSRGMPWLKWILALVSVAYLVYMLSSRPLGDVRPAAPLWLVPAFLLCPLNWWLELVKWRMLCGSAVPLPFSRFIGPLLSGVSLSVFTPNRIGEFAGRVWGLPPRYRWSAGMASVMGSFAQLGTTLFVGGLALAYQTITSFALTAPFAWWIVLWFGLPVLLALWLAPVWLRYLLRQSKLKLAKRLVKASLRIRPKHMALALSFSLLRYLVFTAQFLACVWAFAPEAELWSTLPKLSLVFFWNTVIPSQAFAEIFTRGSLSVYLLGADYGLHASLWLWAINLALPALPGAFWLWRSSSQNSNA